MTLVQMTLTGGVIILCTVILRALFMNHLPKRTFIALWTVALMRMLIPFSIPFKLSLYSATQSITEEARMMSVAPEPIQYFVRQTVRIHSIAPAVAQVPMKSAPVELPSASIAPALTVWPKIDWLMVVYVALALALGAYMLSAYVYLRGEYRAAKEVKDGFAPRWLEGQKIYRKVRILASPRIESPITYGLMKPCILLPEALLCDERQLNYVLTHEMTHIRRFDAPMKLLFAAGLCVHWFNPLAWVMYVLYNRDVELSCDEQVVKLLGTGSRADYATLLLDMQTGQSRLTPLSSGFSRHCIKERIVAIMKYKKTSALAMLLAVVIVTSVTCALATSATAPTPEPAQTEGIVRTAPIIVPEAFTDARLTRIYSQTDLPNVKCFGWMDEANRENSTILSRIYYYLTCEADGAVTYQELPAEAKRLMADYQKELNAFIAKLTSDQIFDEARQSVNKAVLLPLLWAERDRLTEKLSVRGMRVRAINFSGEVLTHNSQWDAFYFTSDFYDNLENPKEHSGSESVGGILAGSIAQPGIVMDWGMQTDGKGFITFVSDAGWTHYEEQFRDPQTGVTFRYIPKDGTENDIEISPDNGITWWKRHDDRLIFFNEDFPDHVIEHMPMDDNGAEPNWAQGWRVREAEKYQLLETSLDKISDAVMDGKVEGIVMPTNGWDSARYRATFAVPMISPLYQNPNLARQFLLAQNEYEEIYRIGVFPDMDGQDNEMQVHYLGVKRDGTMKKLEFELKEGEELPKFDTRRSILYTSGEYMEDLDESNRILYDLRKNGLERLLTLRAANHQEMTVAEFDTLIQEKFTQDEIAQIPSVIESGDLPNTSDGENGFFLIGYILPSAYDIIWRAQGKQPDRVPCEVVICDAWKAMKELGATQTSMSVVMEYEVIDPDAITTLERAERIRACAGEAQEFVAQLGADVLYGPDLAKVLKAESDALSEKYGTDAIRFRLKESGLYYTYKGTEYRDWSAIEGVEG